MNSFIKMINSKSLPLASSGTPFTRESIATPEGQLPLIKGVAGAQRQTGDCHSLIRSLAYLLIATLLTASMTSCKKDDSSLYGVNNETLLPPGAGKTKVKSNEQYVSILYANLFQQALGANELYKLSQCIESIGDKDLAKEVIISNFMNKPGVQIPADSTMRNDVPTFVVDTYNRFLVRNPTEAEKTWFVNYINANPNVTPELVYFSFAISDEYQYY